MKWGGERLLFGALWLGLSCGLLQAMAALTTAATPGRGSTLGGLSSAAFCTVALWAAGRAQRREQALQSALKASLEEQLRARRAVAAGHLAQHVAHDLHAPLAAVEAALHHATRLDPPFATLLQQALRRLRLLASRLLPEARPIELRVQPVLPLLQAVISENQLLQCRAVGSRVSLSHHAGADGLRARLAGEAFKQVILNLLDNALQASDAETPIHLHLQGTATTVQVRLIDRGSGMSKSQLRRVGDWGFSRGKAGGHGLGLHAARQELASCGGELHLLSRPGVGTTATIVLPLVT